MLEDFNNFYIVSDLHLHHRNICLYCPKRRKQYYLNNGDYARQNALIHEMDEMLLSQFDELPEGSTVINLGDIFLSSHLAYEELKSMIDRMHNGNKKLWLVLGNHDKVPSRFPEGYQLLDPITFWKNVGFDKVFEFPVLIENKFLLSHEPVYMEPGTVFVNIHGHIHDSILDEDYFNRSCENHEMMDRVIAYNVSKQTNLDIFTGITRSDRKVDINSYRNVCWDYLGKPVPLSEVLY